MLHVCDNLLIFSAAVGIKQLENSNALPLSYKIIWPARTDCKSPNLTSDLCGSACEIFGNGF